MLESIQTALYILEIVIGVGLLIFVHEFGHFLMAKRHRVRVDVFSLGFGPALWKRKKGETEYRISMIPLGGYVKMAGETQLDERTGAEYEFVSKPAWQRFQIFVAGALMNILIAFPLCIIAFLVGRTVPAPVLGDLSMADQLAYLRTGDHVVEVDGQKIVSLDQYHRAVLEHPQGAMIQVKVRRGQEEVTKHVRQIGSEQHISQPPANIISRVNENSPGYRAGLRARDRIISMNGKDVYTDTQIIEQLERHSPDQTTLTMRVERIDPATQQKSILDFTITPDWMTYYEISNDRNLIPARVAQVIPGSPAENLLQAGDEIKAINGEPIVSWDQVLTRVKGINTQPDKQDEMEVNVHRNGQPVTVKVKPINGRLGAAFDDKVYKSQVIAVDPPEGTYFHASGLRKGDQLKSIGSKVGALTLVDLFISTRSATDIPVEIIRNGKTETLQLKPKEKTIATIGIETIEDQPKLKILWHLDFQKFFRTYAVGEAFQEGLYEPYSIGILTFKVLYKLFAREESAKNLAGPVGIFHVTYKSAEQGLGNFLWLLALLAVNLGVFNLLPIPVLDGGHVLLLLFEKIKGKPLSDRFVATFQYVGLAFLLTLVIYVTYADISRLSN